MTFGCATGPDPDPLGTLSDPSLGRQQIRALETLDTSAPNDPATIKALEDVIARDGYRMDVREAALDRLAQRDLAAAKLTVRRSLPVSKSWPWITRVCQIIAERGWVDLSPALASSWARPVDLDNDALKRPEYIALAKLHGAENVTEVIYKMFIDTDPAASGLRERCWDLLHRLGQRERLLALLASSDVPKDDPLLLDLRAGAIELGIVPRNKEEILWLRKLREPGRAEFWSRAVAAVQNLSAPRRAELELRDLPIIVSASLHDHELLAMSRDELYQRVDGYLRHQQHYVQESNYEPTITSSDQRLSEYRDSLTWGDLAAMMIAIRAVQVPEVAAHLFDFAERDRADKSTEYGGVIALDGKDRFEIREFAPLIRQSDVQFIASQAMLDAAYTSIFHFHLHAQSHRNDKFAGPGYGDLNYADNTRANCLVFTFMNQNTLNVDFYRHDRLVVDLGEVKRPSGQSFNLRRDDQAVPTPLSTFGFFDVWRFAGAA